MGSLHWLIVVPYYFFGALALISALVLASRILRLQLGINAIVITSILASLLGLVVPLSFGWIHIDQLTGLRAGLLLVASFLFAGIDALLKDRLPLRLDDEIEAEE